MDQNTIHDQTAWQGYPTKRVVYIAEKDSCIFLSRREQPSMGGTNERVFCMMIRFCLSDYMGVSGKYWTLCYTWLLTLWQTFSGPSKELPTLLNKVRMFSSWCHCERKIPLDLGELDWQHLALHWESTWADQTGYIGWKERHCRKGHVMPELQWP